MAQGNKAFTVQESVNPHYYATGTIKSDSVGVAIPSRAVVNNGTAADVTLTFEDGTTQAIHMLKGVVYPFAAIGASGGTAIFIY